MSLCNGPIVELILAIITGVISFVGLKLKTLYEEKINNDLKKKIVFDTVKYIEQVTKNISITSEYKKTKAKRKILEWLREKQIEISNTELDILIESAVNSLKEK